MNYKSFGLVFLIGILPTQVLVPSVLAADLLPEKSPVNLPLPVNSDILCLSYVSMGIPRVLIKIEEMPIKSRYIADIAIQYTANGQYEQALTILKNIKDIDFQAYALVKMAGHLQLKEPQITLNLISQIQKMLPKIDRDAVRYSVLGDIAVLYAKAGKFSEALQTLPLIKEKGEGVINYKIETIIKIAIEYAVQGNLDKARNLLKLLPDEYDVDEGLWKIGREYAILGKYDQAFDFASKMERYALRAIIVENIFTSALKNGKINQVMPKILNIKDQCTKYQLVYYMVISDEVENKLRAKTEKLQRLNFAVKIAQTMEEGFVKTRTLENIAKEYIEIEGIDELVQLTQNTLKGDERNETISLLFKYYLNNQQLEQAVKFANVLDNSRFKAEGLTAIAKSYAALGQKEKANELLNQALEIGQSLEQEYYLTFPLF